MRAETVGNATLYLGDCMEVLSLLDRSSAVVCDPPFGTGFSFGSKTNRPKQKDGNLWGRDWGEMQGDDSPFDPTPWLAFSECVLWGANWYCDRLPPAKRWLVWQKGVPENWSGSAHELAWTSIKGGGIWARQILWHGFRRECEVREHYHPTQKPVGLMQWCIEMTKADVIVDPYMGSGTTGVAAAALGRKFIGVEIVPEFFATALDRISAAQAQGRLFV